MRNVYYTGSRKDSLFRESVTEIRKLGVKLHEDHLLVLYRYVHGDINHAASIRGEFWRCIPDSTVIKIGDPKSSFYNLVFTYTRGPMEMNQETVIRSGFLLKLSHEGMKVSLTAFYNAEMRQLREAALAA